MTPLSCRPVLVVEGPDGAGKSTLAERLSDHYRYPIVHTGGPLESRREYEERLIEKEILKARYVIFDRVPMISELVYYPLQKRGPFITIEEGLRDLRAARPVLIYCRLSSSEKMVSRILKTKKSHKTPEYLKKVQQEHRLIVASYDTLMLHVPQETLLRYDWERDSFDFLVQAINARMEPSCVG